MEELYNDITKHLQNGGAVMIFTYSKAWILRAKHLPNLRLSNNGKELFMRRGKSWDCVSYCGFRFSK